jgi:hypothetical protein
MFTSFGYLPSEKEDARSLNEVHRVLQRNGHFLLDVVNKDYVTNVYKERDWAEFPPFYLLEKRTLDPPKSMLRSEWTLIKKNTKEVRHIQHDLRLYSFTKLRKMLGKVGLAVKQVYGGYDKKKFNSDASRMIMLARKK